ncbi:helix-turn-helix transcriptional regulator [Chitinibacter bivalviorum]|uniref:Helix-turn-helix transcriptional regulator n=1 Tax=Chitinibacter bivalviorum TaxID=2739434 RepID=A0A7H9BHT4_9NEIS|nr:metalloregulator ArsR/SmtB family transcription factor [Chitinibacter bivalviorum]QLG87836.1 helix-turn-helix transcriptional regulator [Chitinibacter bivalviorum]
MTDLEMQAMRSAACNAIGLLKNLANEDRLMLLCQMVDGEKCVSDFEALLDIRQPTLSQQLGVLRNAGLVNTRRDGKRIYYSLASQEVHEILSLLYKLYCPIDLNKFDAAQGNENAN